MRPAPRSPWQSHMAEIAAIREETPGVRTYDLVLREPAAREAFRFEPGQFNMLHLPGIGEAALSVSSDPARPAVIGHTVRALGNVTQALARLTPGAEVVLRGPFGTPWPLDALRGRDVAIVAGGVGLASLRAAICRLAADRTDYGRITILHGAKTPADLLYEDDHAAWRAAGIDVRTIVDRPDDAWRGPTGFVSELLDGLGIAAADMAILCCGPEPMMGAVGERAFALGLAPADLFVSLERNMACAAGICGLCQFGPAFVCKDGPVFRHDRIARFLGVANL